LIKRQYEQANREASDCYTLWVSEEEDAMLATKLRQVGDSTMMEIPSELLSELHLQAGDAISVTVEGGRLVIVPRQRPKYTLAELLDASDYSEPDPPEEREWVDTVAAGRELL
jgi:antitoxin ChpS